MVLLFGSNKWVMNPRLDKALEGFIHQAVCGVAGMGHKYQWYGTWMYPPIGAGMEMVGLDEFGVYISCRQNTVAKYIAAFPIMDLCLAAEQNPGLILSRRWWEHPTLDIPGIRAWNLSAEVWGETGKE